MALFSERYGYVNVSDVIIREKITPEIQNAICSCFDRLEQIMIDNTYDERAYMNLEKYLWVFFLNKREKEFYTYNGYHIVATNFIESDIDWYKKLDLIEATIKYLYALERNPMHHPIVDEFSRQLNFEFERHKFAYRVIDKEIVEITSQNEIVSIETALATSSKNVQLHLNKALELYSLRPVGDYRNSIKEAISAVEVENPGSDDPLDQVELTPEAKISLTLLPNIKMTPVDVMSAGDFICIFEFRFGRRGI